MTLTRLLAIVTTANLVAGAGMPASGAESIASNIWDEGEIMFAIDIPYVPEQQETILLAQESSMESYPADYVLEGCQEVPHDLMGAPRAAFHSLYPTQFLRFYLGNQAGHALDPAEFRNSVLLEMPIHGTITPGKIDGYFFYDPMPGYKGHDRAVFQVEYQGKVYRIVYDLVVVEVLDEKSPLCPEEPSLIKVKPNDSGVIGYYGFNFFDISGSSLAQTIGTGPTAQITLDLDAAGHGWYIDYTPYLNEKYPINGSVSFSFPLVIYSRIPCSKNSK
jgi:hypothetical protein